MAATLWTIWLSRNELAFSGNKITRATVEHLIFTRVSEWGKATCTLPFGSEPLWKINPHGIIAVHFDKLQRDFWKFKFIAFELVCLVDGAWGRNIFNNWGGGIGGSIYNNKGTVIYSFSGPCSANSILEAEIKAILHVAKVLDKEEFKSFRVSISSDSREAIDFFKEGYDWQVSHKLNLIIDASHVPLNLNDLSSKLCFVQRELNQNADNLAKKGLARPTLSSYWNESYLTS